MLISYNWLASYMSNPEHMPTPEKVADIFTMRAFEIESMEEKHGDTVYDIKILPDRSPYAYGIRYIALELALRVPELKLKPQYEEYMKTDINISGLPRNIVPTLIDDSAKELCSLYTLTYIEGVHNNPTHPDLATKLTILGQQSRGAIVDLTNFIMNDTGQPLHAFDADKIEGTIRVSVLDEDQEVTILGGKKVSLKKGTLVIRDNADILAIAGVKGCVKAEVTAETKNIYLESASFDRVAVRKTSRSLDIINDSSKRFEQGVTTERTIVALQAFVEQIQELMPTAVIHAAGVSRDIAYVFDQNKLVKIDVNVDKCVKLVDDSDTSLSAKFVHFMEHTLPKTGAKVEKVGDGYTVIVPAYRADLEIEADVVDEFIRDIGYDAVAYVPTEKVREVTQEKRFRVLQAVRRFLVLKGYTEVQLHTLVDSKKNGNAVKLANALTSERDALRAELAPELLGALIKNYAYLDLVEKKTANLFEIGVVHSVYEKAGYPPKGIVQRTHLALGVGMPKWPKKIDESMLPVTVLAELCESLGLNADILTTALKTESKDTTAKVIELNITDIIESVDESKLPPVEIFDSESARIKTFPYKKASIYPSMSRDIAFFVEGDVTPESVDDYIRDVVKTYPLIETTTLFDVFSKEGRTSYGYRFVFQSYEKTLTEEEVSTIMSNIAEGVQSKGWIVR